MLPTASSKRRTFAARYFGKKFILFRVKYDLLVASHLREGPCEATHPKEPSWFCGIAPKGIWLGPGAWPMAQPLVLN